jgi:hypothetical protein
MSAAEDLRKKLALERKLAPALGKYHAEILRNFTNMYARVGIVPPMSRYDAALASILAAHYAAAQSAFTGSISDDMPPGAELTPAEKAAIAAALVAYFKRKADSRAADINKTTEDDLSRSVRMAVDTQEQDKPPLSRIEIAFLAAGIAHRVLSSRGDSIAVTETQLGAEATKATEAEVLYGMNPTVAGGDQVRGDGQPTKVWESVGDDRVRDAHLEADGQEVPISEPFIVDGESLMFPGDPSLGASAGNIINCRCSVSYNTAEIADQRQEV